MRFAITRALALSAIVLAAGCASSGTSNSATPAGYKPPTLVSGGINPELNFPNSGNGSVSVTFEVMVDAAGRPDLKTLKLSGTGAEVNRETMETWLSRVKFKPATVNDVPVSSPFKSTVGATKKVTRVRQ